MLNDLTISVSAKHRPAGTPYPRRIWFTTRVSSRNSLLIWSPLRREDVSRGNLSCTDRFFAVDSTTIDLCILTSPVCSPSIPAARSSSYGRKVSPNTRCLWERTSSTDRTACFSTKLSGLQERGTSTTIRPNLGESFTTPQTLDDRLFITPTISTLAPRISRCSTDTAGRWNV